MPNPQNSINLLQISDMHIPLEPGETLLGIDTEYYFHATLENALARGKKIDAMLVTGDLVQQPHSSSYQRILHTLQKLPFPCLCLPGNHDNEKLMQNILNSGNVSCSKQTLLGSWQIICLNSLLPDEESGFLAGDELAFLEHCLQSTPQYPTVIAVHHHCHPINSAWMDTMIIENHVEFTRLLQNHSQVKVIVHGHIHQSLDISYEHFHILGTPSTCFQFKPASRHFELDSCSPGYRFLELLTDGQYITTVHRLPEVLQNLCINSEGY